MTAIHSLGVVAIAAVLLLRGASGFGAEPAGSSVDAALAAAGRADLARLWAEGRALGRSARALERDDPQQAISLYLRAARHFERIAGERPALVPAYWRGARSYWLAGDTLPVEIVEDRIEYFERAEALSTRGIETEPDCAECMLWKFAAMGRLRTARGIFTSVRQLSEMADLLDRGIALEPSYADSPTNSTLGNLHYSSAIFYRVFPDWFWIGWLLGVKGDKERALGHVQTALALHPTRLDYRIELGSQLLCLGSTRGNDAQLDEGREVLQAAILLEPETQDDAREIAAAHIMLEAPAKSCGYAGDTWIELDEREARAVSRLRPAP